MFRWGFFMRCWYDARMAVEIPSPDEICREVAKTTDRVCLSFSCGKDSLATWVVLRRHFKTILPVYRYLLPDLGFVEQSLRYYEQFFGERIRRVPSAYLWRMLNARAFMTSGQARSLTDDFPEFLPNDACRDVIEDENWPEETPIMVGWRMGDALGRLMTIRTHGWKTATGIVFPLAATSRADLMTILRESGCKLPVDYRMWGRSFDALRGWFLPALKQHYPADYAKIIDWFPMLELEALRWQ